ncbi:MAG: bacterial transcriptional activator domain-containing protein, partial [Dermatophilaceae bacterium]
DHTPGKPPDSPGTSLKILTQMALHPGGGHEELDQSVWPGQDKRSTTRAAPVSATRTWLGTAPDGHPYVAIHTVDGGYRLADDMYVDWLVFQDLIGVDIADATTQHLVDALGLVYGKPLSGPRIADTPAEAEIIATVGDVAHELAVRALTTGDPTLAAWAAGKGLDAEPVSEVLWRDLLRAAHQTGDPNRVRDVITQLDTVMDPVGGDLEPDTEALITQLTRRDPAPV